MEDDLLYRQIGDNIRRGRAGRLTQAQLAVEIGISRASLANIEVGRQKILVHHLYAIARALELDSLSALIPELASPQTEPTTPAAFPLPEEGLNEKQRSDVLRLMERAPSYHDDSKQGDAS